MTDNTQGQDGRPFLSYYDHVHALSFVWDGTIDAPGIDGRWIDVSFGGAGEPVVLRIPWVIRLTGPVPGNVTTDVLAAFATTCQDFISLLHAVESVDEQAHGKEQA